MIREKKIIKDTMVSEYLGDSSRIRVLEFLINNKDNSYGIVEIAKYSKSTPRNLIDTLKDLLEKDMIYIEKRLGKSNLYKINEFEAFVQSLMFAMVIYRK